MCGRWGRPTLNLRYRRGLLRLTRVNPPRLLCFFVGPHVTPLHVGVSTLTLVPCTSLGTQGSYDCNEVGRSGRYLRPLFAALLCPLPCLTIILQTPGVLPWIHQTVGFIPAEPSLPSRGYGLFKSGTICNGKKRIGCGLGYAVFLSANDLRSYIRYVHC